MSTNIKKQIPNLLTLANLFFGLKAIEVFILYPNSLETFYWLIPCLVFDVADGTAARLLNAGSELGKFLDGLTDAISFGLLPTLWFWRLMLASGANQYAILFSFMILAGSVYRLAKFTTDNSDNANFMGVPTPYNAMLVASICITDLQLSSVHFLTKNSLILGATAVLLSILMNAPILLYSFKIKSGQSLIEMLPSGLFILSILVTIMIGVWTLPIFFILYVLASIFFLQPQKN